MVLRLKFILTFSLAILMLNVLGQEEAGGDKGQAKDNFSYGNWKAALTEYGALVKQEPDNPLYNYRLGICYLETYIDKKQAITYLKKAVELGIGEKDALFMLGKAYHLNYKFDDALATYKKAIDAGGDSYLMSRANRYIEMCNNAREQIKYRLRGVKIENLGPNVNSPEPDYTPFILEDESELYFTSRRTKGNQGYLTWDGYFTTDIFMCKESGGKWKKVRSIGGSIGTSDDEEIVGLTPDGKIMFTNVLTFNIQGEILQAKRRGRQYQRPFPMDPPVNSVDREYSAALSPDKQVLYFASERPDGIGGFDIYVTRKLPTGEWGEVQSMQNINTEWDELFPHVSGDGKMFFFASEGHSSMGGFDIFRCDWDDEKNQWGTPKNIGYPINTPNDEMHIAMTKNNRVGYFSSHRKDAIGDLDIYQITFQDVEDRNSVVRGKISYLAPIDYNDYKEFHFYKKGDIVRKFTEEFMPPDTSWEFVRKKKSIVKPGFKYKVYLTLEKDSVEKKYSLAKAPLDKPGYTFKDIKISLFPIKDYKPPKKTRPTQTNVIAPDAFIMVEDKRSGDLMGEYAPAPRTGKYIVILPPGEFTMMIDADGFKSHTENIVIIGKSSFRPEIVKNIILTPLKEPSKVHYSDLE